MAVISSSSSGVSEGRRTSDVVCGDGVLDAGRILCEADVPCPGDTEREDEEEQPSMSLPFTIALLVAVTAVRPSFLGVIVNKLTLP